MRATLAAAALVLLAVASAVAEEEIVPAYKHCVSSTEIAVYYRNTSDTRAVVSCSGNCSLDGTALDVGQCGGTRHYLVNKAPENATDMHVLPVLLDAMGRQMLVSPSLLDLNKVTYGGMLNDDVDVIESRTTLRVSFDYDADVHVFYLTCSAFIDAYDSVSLVVGKVPDTPIVFVDSF